MKRMVLTRVAALLLCASAMTGCGTVLGAGAGAGAGAAVAAGTGHDPGRGALIGAGVGGAAGAIYDIRRRR